MSESVIDAGLDSEIWSDTPIVRRLVWLGALTVFAVGLLAALTFPNPTIAQVVAVVGVPLSVLVIAMAWGIDRPVPAAALALLFDVDGLILASTARAGLGLGVLVPILGIAAVAGIVHGRAWIALGICSWIAATAAAGIAVTVGPAAGAIAVPNPIVTILGFGAVGTLALTLAWRARQIESRAIAVARRAAAHSAASAAERARTAELLRAVSDSSPVATMAFGLDRTVLAWNLACERLFGWTAEETVGRPLPIEMVPPDERGTGNERIARTFAGSVIQGDRVRRMSKDGREVLVEIYAAAIRGDDGEPIGIAGQMVDVTARVALERQLSQAQRLEAIGLLAGGISHDFNNTLTAVGGFAELIASTTREPETREDAETIVATVDRARRFTGELLSFARRSPHEAAVVDLAATTSIVESMLRRLLGGAIDLVIEGRDRIVRARIDAAKLEQAIFNLAVNARDAMPVGGRVTISVGTVDVAAGSVRSDLSAEGEFAVVKVSDTGTGIAAVDVDRIFEPFYTTKDPGRGTGLGLAMVLEFANQSGGHVVVASQPGAGATFEIRLPLASGAIDCDAIEDRPAVAGGSETILVVEDEPAVASLERQILERLGYRVLLAPDGIVALDLANAHGGPIDLLLTDVDLPRLSGPDLAARMASFRPEAAVILVSGRPTVLDDARAAGRPTLEKPFNRDGLGAIVRQVLDARGRAA